MSTIKVNTIDNNGSNVDFPNKLKVRGNAIEQGYTASGTEPSSPSAGDIWYDSTNDKTFQYINGEFKEVSIKPILKNAGDRAVHHRGYTTASGVNAKSLDYWAISTLGNAADFGDLLTEQRSYGRGSVSDRTYGIFFPQYNTNVIERIAFGSLGNAVDFGDTTVSGINYACYSDGTYGYYIHARVTGASNPSTPSIDRFTIATAANATDFGYDYGTARSQSTGLSDGTTGFLLGGQTTSSASSVSNTVEYITLATPANSSDYGDLTLARFNIAGAANLSRAVTSGGQNVNGSSVNLMDYFSVTTAGSATDFGDLSQAAYQQGATTNGTRMCIAGGWNTSYNSPLLEIFYVEMDTAGNAAAFGNLTANSSDANTASGNA
jgi:hypothetical protein